MGSTLPPYGEAITNARDSRQAQCYVLGYFLILHAKVVITFNTRLMTPILEI